jgi:hypothetical protein
MFLGSKVRLVLGTDKHTAIYMSRLSRQCWILNISQPYSCSWRNISGICYGSTGKYYIEGAESVRLFRFLLPPLNLRPVTICVTVSFADRHYVCM